MNELIRGDSWSASTTPERRCEDWSPRAADGKMPAVSDPQADRDVATLTILRHANVINLLGVEYAAETTRIVLEDGGTDLYWFVVNHGKIDQREAMGFFHQLVAAVEYMHSRRLWSAPPVSPTVTPTSTTRSSSA